MAIATFGNDIQQRDYVDDGNLKDEWMICIFNNATLIAKEETSDNQKSFYFENTKTLLQKRRRNKVSIVKTYDFFDNTETTDLNYMLSSAIFVECAHGNKVSFRISGNESDPPFDGDGIYAGVLAYMDLSTIEFCYFMSCSSAQDYNPNSTCATNLVRGTEMGGVQCVIGFSEVIDRNDANNFLNYLLRKCIVENKTIGQAYAEFYICNNRDYYNNNYIRSNFKDCIIITSSGLDYKF